MVIDFQKQAAFDALVDKVLETKGIKSNYRNKYEVLTSLITTNPDLTQIVENMLTIYNNQEQFTIIKYLTRNGIFLVTPL